MAYLTYLGGVMLINLSEGRGASGDEVSKLAKRAGYSNGRAVNGFSINGASTESREDGRWVTDRGRECVKKLADDLGIELPEITAKPGSTVDLAVTASEPVPGVRDSTGVEGPPV